MLFDLSHLVNDYGLSGRLLMWQWPHCKKRYVARHLIKNAVKEGRLRKHQRIVEWSSGNLAKEICKIASVLMHPVSIVEGNDLTDKLPAWVDIVHPKKLLNAEYNSKISKRELDCVTSAYAKKVNGCYLNQLGDIEHIRIYEDFTNKLIRVLPKIDAFTEHVGSGATLIGIGNVLKNAFDKLEIVVSSKNGRDVQESIVFKIPFDYKLQCENSFCSYSKTIKSELCRSYGIRKCEHGINNITAALQWLKNNPGKTIFTTIGD